MNSVFAARDPLWLGCISLLAFNALVAVTCLVLGPGLWTRLLCAITGHFNTILVFVGMGCAASGLLDQNKLDLAPYIWIFLVVLGQLAILRSISHWRLRDPSAFWWPK